MTDATVTSTVAEASTSAPPDPRAIMAALGVSCATCRWWDGVDTAARHGRAFRWCEAAPLEEDYIRATASAVTAGGKGLLTRADHYCAMWKRRT